ncbi:hypothetical protein [Nocardia africana]|uniref:Uncharacterized protein n=1 Tax=Nocardia africana TaxID=134964 RepID=A0ABW6NJA6_9NOCA
MTEPSTSRRTIALLRSDHDPDTYEALTRQHRLEIVYTVHTDALAVLAALIVAQYAFEYAADTVVIPHLRALEDSSPWWAITQVADLVTATRKYPKSPAPIPESGREQ